MKVVYCILQGKTGADPGIVSWRGTNVTSHTIDIKQNIMRYRLKEGISLCFTEANLKHYEISGKLLGVRYSFFSV